MNTKLNAYFSILSPKHAQKWLNIFVTYANLWTKMQFGFHQPEIKKKQQSNIYRELNFQWRSKK